jgi:hypothetical protein
LTDAQIIATLTTGKGEAVSFKELKIDFENHFNSQKSTILQKKINIFELGMNYGDELYFYIEVKDNKTIPQVNRSEIYFVSLKDTAQEESASFEGIAVDFVPEYFRSQRQIIIDTEKLLKIKSQISPQVFKERCQDLAFDQKSLRLRYSKFLGEEFETGLTHAEMEVAHSEEVEHEESSHEEEHHHEHNVNPEEKTDILEPFIHRHDSQEEATFFAKETRMTLKQALAEMWQAELYFHLHEPKKSLPYCHKALNILKFLQQKDRAYISRSNEQKPPIPIKEKRLTGKQEDIFSPQKSTITNQSDEFKNIRQAIFIVERLQNSQNPLTNTEREILESAYYQVVKLVKNNGKEYLVALQSLQKVIGNQSLKDCQDCLLKIEQVLWQLLPMPTPKPSANVQSHHKLSSIFYRKLNEIK